jgi:RNA polymerase sigma-70 factor (ECF subfamily)
MTTDVRARIRAGDRDAFAQLFDEYAKAVYNHAYWLTADWSVADDVVSATFLQAWRGRAKVDVEGGSLRPWLLGIATNIVRNQRRGDRRYRAVAAAMVQQHSEVPDHADRVDGRLDDGRRLAAAVAALATLRRSDREVLTLCLWQGVSYADAAVVLGVRVGTVRSRLSRAREKLRVATEVKFAARNREPDVPARQVEGNRTTAHRKLEGHR